MRLIYRVCDSKNAVSSGGKRCFDVDKSSLIKCCLDSIRTCLKNLDPRVKLDVHVIADNCSDEIVDVVHKTFSECDLQRTSLGNAKSFCECIEIGTSAAFDDNDIVFMLEDDYLFLNNNVFSKMAAAFQ